MSYKLVKGEFHLFYTSTRHVGSRPDGDSMWFKPNNPAYLSDLEGRSVDFNGGGCVQLRIEGIDALELHYSGSNHQKTPECVDARDHLLGEAGYTEVTYAPSSSGGIDTSVRTATPQPLSGYILTRTGDPFGRPVAFAFAGGTNKTDGSGVWLDASLMNISLNASLVRAGQTYPAFYTGLPVDLRNELTKLSSTAQKKKLGLWPSDVSMSGAQVGKMADLEKYAIWPKLYRRLFSYFDADNLKLKDFDNWIRNNPDKDDPLWIISRGEYGNMHDIYKVKGRSIEMTVRPDDIVIVPK